LRAAVRDDVARHAMKSVDVVYKESCCFLAGHNLVARNEVCHLGSRSTTTKMDSKVLDGGRSTMKSMDMDVHGVSGIGRG
jgi:hypothetical protein